MNQEALRIYKKVALLVGPYANLAAFNRDLENFFWQYMGVPNWKSLDEKELNERYIKIKGWQKRAWNIALEVGIGGKMPLSWKSQLGTITDEEYDSYIAISRREPRDTDSRETT